MSVGVAASGAPLPAWADRPRPAGDAPFVEERRSAASAALAARGMPTRKTESFRFTSVRDLVETAFVAPSTEADADSAAVLRALGHDDTYRIIVADGRASLAGSTRDGVRVVSFEEALEHHASEIERVFSRLVPNEHFAAANTASFVDAVVVIVPEGVRATVPVHLAHVVTANELPCVTSPRVLILAGANSHATVVETYLGDRSGRSLCNAVVEVSVGDGATIEHVVVLESRSPTVVAVGASVGASATYHTRDVLLGGKLTRLDHHLAMAGEGGRADVGSVLLARGDDHVDHHVRIEHRAPRTTSVQRSRGIADERGTSVFDAIVVVRPTAPGCEVSQESKNLLLSADACVHAKPQLEIEIDEVVASHGTTVGSFDRDQLFYLRARGIDGELARAMLTHGFVKTVLDDVGVAAVRQRLERALLARLPEGDAALAELLA